MRHQKAIIVFIAFSILLMRRNALADEVRLKNGGVLPGEIVGMEDGKLVLKTSYAGEISITWSEVATLRTDASAQVVIEHDDYSTSSRAIIESAEEGTIKLKTGEMQEVVSSPLAEVAAINPRTEPRVKVKADSKCGIDVEKGNTDSEEYHLDGNLIVRTDADRWTLRGEYEMEESNNKKTDDNWEIFTKYDYFLTKKWYLTSLAYFENDDFEDLDLRTRVGGGAGYQFLETAEKNLGLQAGLSFVFENYIVADNDKHSEGLWLLEYDRWLFEKKFKFYHRHMGFIGLEDIEDWRIETITGFQIPIYRRLSIGVQFDYDYDKTPSSEEDEWDYQFLFTAGWHYEN